MPRPKIKVWVAFAVTTLAAASCVSDTGGTTPNTPAHQHAHGKIAYLMGWEWGKAKPDPGDRGGWHVINDLGYVIHVTDGVLVNAALQLVPCVESAGLFAPKAAYANHGSGQPDSTRWAGPLRKSLRTPDALDLGSVTVGDHRYCQAHYLLAQDARKDGNTMVALGPTLALTGTYTAPSGGAPVPFVITTRVTWGGPTTLPSNIIVNGNTGQAPHCLMLMRNLGALFDGVNFAGVPSDEQARAVLRSLTTHIEIYQHQM